MAGYLHLEALMNEHCGQFLLDESDAAGRQYICKSMWLFHYWGAMRKVAQMRNIYKFLAEARRPPIQTFTNRALQHIPSAKAAGSPR